MTEDFIKKLMVSKKIMDRHKEMPRGQAIDDPVQVNRNVVVEDYKPVSSTYVIPEEFASVPQTQVTQKKTTTKERILGSKLPDNIKRLMIEHPIDVPSQEGPVLTDDLIEKASRLMKSSSEQTIPNQKVIKESKQLPQYNNDIKSIVRETMEEILRENGLLVENVTKSDDVFSFRVGKHVFEGKVLKIKKLK